MEELSLDPGERLYEVIHVTRYDYSDSVSLSLQSIRLTPRFRRFTQIIEPAPQGNLRFLRDAFENPTYSYELIGQTRSIEMKNQMKVVRSGTNPFDFILANEALERPIQYNSVEKQGLSPYFDLEARNDPVLQSAMDSFGNDEKDTITFLTALNSALHTQISYQPRDEPGIFTAKDILENRVGSCRDYAFLLQKLLHFEGLATRFVSGYLLETGDMQGAEAMHAWTEVYLPGAGWIGLDPTNGVLTDDAFVPCAVAIDPEGTTPIGGRYFAVNPVKSELSTELQISLIRG